MLSFWLPYVVLKTTFLTKREEMSDSLFFLRDLSLMLFLFFSFFFFFGLANFSCLKGEE